MTGWAKAKVPEQEAKWVSYRVEGEHLHRRFVEAKVT